MSDSLKTRVGRVIAGGMHALLDRIEDLNPQAAMEQAIREAGTVVDEVRHELGVVSANRHLAQQQHARLNRSHEELSDQIAQALAAQREDLAFWHGTRRRPKFLDHADAVVRNVAHAEPGGEPQNPNNDRGENRHDKQCARRERKEIPQHHAVRGTEREHGNALSKRGLPLEYSL